MGVGRATWLGVAAGCVLGSLVALAGMQAPERAPLPSAEPRPALPHGSVLATSASISAPGAATSVPSAGSATPAASPITVIPSASLSDPSSIPPPTVSPASSVTPAASSLAPQTAKQLERAEIRCDQGDADACAQAALAYETGSTGHQDPERARKFRLIRLTFLGLQCESSSPAACAELGRMYRDGDGVEKRPGRAELLFKRVQEVCKWRDAGVCHAQTP